MNPIKQDSLTLFNVKLEFVENDVVWINDGAKCYVLT